MDQNNLHVASPCGLDFLTAWWLDSNSKSPWKIKWKHMASLQPDCRNHVNATSAVTSTLRQSQSGSQSVKRNMSQ